MRLFKNIVLTIHILAVIIAIVFILTSDHAIIGKGFKKALQGDYYTYITEDASSFSVLYKGDIYGTVSNVYKSNQEKSGVTIADFDLQDEIYLLQKTSTGYEVKKVSQEDLFVISKSDVFTLNEIEEITDFYVDLNANSAFITAISEGRMSAVVLPVRLDTLVSVETESKDKKSDSANKEPAPLSVQYRLDSNTGRIDTAYFDGTNIITDSLRPVSNSVDTYGYSSGLNLTYALSFKVNTTIFVILFAYLIAGIILIILVYNLISRRRRLIDLLLLNEILILILMSVAILMFSTVLVPVIWAVIASILNIVILLLENRDIMILCKDMKLISNGIYDIEKPLGTSVEVKTLWRGMNEVQYLYEQYKYILDTNAAAAVRFLPHNISSMFRVNSLDEIKPGDSMNISGAYMMLKSKKEITNELVSLVEQYEKKSGGTLLTSECSPSELNLLFANPNGNEVSLGLKLYWDMADDSSSTLYFKDDYKISVVGTQTKSILNITSEKMPEIERLSSWFFEMGIKMVITEEIKEISNIESPLRLIGYAEINGNRTNFYEVLNAYNERIRSNRIKSLPDFENALSFMYQDNFYLARTAFSDILKEDPTDELTRWYLFICENYLNNPEITDRTCALNPRN